MKTIKKLAAGAILAGVLLGGAQNAHAYRSICGWIYSYLGSDASDEMSDADYAALISYYNAHC